MAVRTLDGKKTSGFFSLEKKKFTFCLKSLLRNVMVGLFVSYNIGNRVFEDDRKKIKRMMMMIRIIALNQD